jgi:heptosyltransferase-2
LLTKAIAVPRPGDIPPHEKFYYLELLRRVGWIEFLPEIPEICLRVSEESLQQAESRLREFGARPRAIRIAVAAGASYGSAKCWPPERFALALNSLLQLGTADILLFGTPAETQVSNAIQGHLRQPAIDLTGKTTISELPELLSRCNLFVGNDSGAMHVAAAVGLPVVAIFGPTDPLGTAPVTPRCAIVQQKPYCSPCFLRRCPIDHRCMTSVSPQMVTDAISQQLAEVSSV